MADLYGFDASQVEPASEFDPLPAGKYPAMITDSELKDTKARNGQYLQLTFQVLDGEYRGRFLWARLNLDNPNATAVKIARAELSAICRAVGVLQPRDSQELHNRPLVVKVKCKKQKESDEITNELCGYESPAAAAGQPTQAATHVPPWARP